MADTDIQGRILDRRKPTDRKHELKYPLRAGLVADAVIPPFEKVLDVEFIRREHRDEYDQGSEGACVGYSQSIMMSIINRRMYDALWLYKEAQKIDPWPETPPEGGTDLNSAFKILHTRGHRRIYAGESKPENPVDGIAAYRWTTYVNDIRAAIYLGIPVNLGINWYRQFSNPEQRPRLDDNGKQISAFGILRYDWWIGAGQFWGRIDGGHAITVVANSDRRQAIGLMNSWGDSYPFLVWLPYAAMERLFGEEGEAGVVTDR